MVLGYVEKSISRFVLSGVFQLSKYLHNIDVSFL